MITQDTKDWWPYYLKATCLLELEYFDEAIMASTYAIGQKCSVVEIWYIRGVALLIMNDVENALKDMEQACELDPKDTRFQELRDYIQQTPK